MPDISGIDESLLNGLSEQERKILFDTLSNLSKGDSGLLNKLKYADFDEIPVDVETFLHDKNYLGNGLIDAEGRFTVFPYWVDVLKKIFPDNLTTNYNTLILTGCLGYDTDIPLLNRKVVKIGELADIAKTTQLDEYVYSFDLETNQYVPGHLINAFSTGIKKVYRITLDNGESFVATSNHKFLTRDKHWKSIDNGLCVGDSLMPSYIKETSKIYWRNPENKVKRGKDITSYNQDEKNIRNYQISKATKIANLAIRDFGELTESTYEETKLKYGVRTGYPSYKSITKRISQEELYERAISYNHTIVDIELVGEQEVFDLTVEKYHNFALNCGIIAHNSIGIGKSFQAVLCMLYLLYRMLCLKDPYLYYGLQPIDKITFSLINVTIDAAKGVAWDKLQQLVQSSPWFMSHGSMSGRTELIWTPDKRIELVVGSSNNAVIGRAVFCLDGETEILTDKGYKKLNSLIGERIRVISYDDGMLCLSNYCHVNPTGITSEEYQIRLDDGTTLKCTKNHRFLLKNNEYVQASDIRVGDELIGVQPDCLHKVVDCKCVTLNDEKQYYDVIDASPFNNFLVRTNSGMIVSHNCNFTDEINFSAMTTDVEKIKKKQKTLISQVDARMQSRFMKGNYLPTLQIIASSKSSDQSFLDSYINTKKKNNSQTTLIIDEPQWVVRNDKQSDKKFYVAVGNKFLASEVLPVDAPESMVESYRAKGYQMMEVPSGYYEAFVDNVDLALTDIAGISSTSALKYISGVRLNETKITNYKNPMTKEILEVGTGDNVQYSQFFDLNAVPSVLKSKPLYVHLDMSKKGDRTGIAGVWIMGKRAGTSERKGDIEAYYRVAFAFAVQAPKGYEISFEKNRNFIRWLKSQGFNIKGISADTFQSTQIMQQLQADGFNTKTISVDRLENIQGTNTKVCIPYAFFKTAIYEKRIEFFQKCDLLTNEIVNLERESDGHIDHPDGGTTGCFVGSTKVILVDGRSLTMKELVNEYESGKENWVYSFNEDTMKIEPKRIRKAWLTIKDAPLVKVTLDNGEEILCTPNHKFMLREGRFCEAQDLISGTALMPLYTWKNHKVLKVEKVDFKEDVFDLEIEDNHNFALDAGVFVHNSKDVADAVCGSTYFASQNIEQFSYNYGEDLDFTLQTNNLNSSPSEVKKQVNIAFEQELQNLLTPASIRKEQEEDKKRINNSPYGNRPIVTNGMLIW